MDEALVIASKMLNLSGSWELPSELTSDLIEVNGLCQLAGGELHSRQVIATIIVTHYRRENERGGYADGKD